MRARLAQLLLTLRTSPLAWVLAAALALHLVGFGWGLPASDAWEDDGIAPRDFMVGAYETYNPGHYFTYPPVHLFGLTLLTAPIWGLAIARAPSLAQADVVGTLIQVPTMTALLVVARLVSEAMALGIVYALAKLAEEVWGPRAGLLVALVVAVNAPLAYYAHTSNLDVPYMCWACFGLLEAARAVVRREPRRFRRAVLFAALAVGTKDQAYAVFLLGFPAVVAAWLLFDHATRGRRVAILREIVIAVGLSGALFLLFSGAVTNPSGFRARVQFLLGPASQNHAYYAPTWEGRWEILKALALGFDRFYPWPFAVAAMAGLGIHLAAARKAPERFAAGLAPLAGALSFVVFFNLTARRTEHRFAFPEMTLLAVYAGVAFDGLLGALEAPRLALLRYGAFALASATLAWGVFECAAVDASLVLDPRYDAEAWLAANVKDQDSVEIYGANAYLPRLPSNARVARVDTSPLRGRNPLPGVVELEAPFADIEARKPRFVVVTEAWSWRWFMDAPPPGRVVPPEQAERQRDEATRAYFRGLHEGRIGYRLAHVSAFASTFWPRRSIHNSTANVVRIFQREM
jgi:hypothetical protein